MKEDKKIKVLRRFFTISASSFEMQHTIAKSFGYLGTRSFMHTLHLAALNEINKENPNLETVDNLIVMMESSIENTKQ